MNWRQTVVAIILRSLFRVFLKISGRRMVMLTMTTRTVAPADIFGKYHFSKAIDIEVERFVTTIRTTDFATRKIFS